MPGNQTEQRPVILTVDAHSKSRATVRAILEPDGFQIMEASDPDSAVRMLNSVSPDLVLLDFNLAGKNGLELALQIKDRLPHTPVIMVTEGRDMRVVVQAIRRGIYDHLTKPLNAHDLRLSVSQALRTNASMMSCVILKDDLKAAFPPGPLGSSDKIQSLVRLLEKISLRFYRAHSKSRAGPQGVGGQGHSRSRRQGGPSLPWIAGIPNTLRERAFGYAKAHSPARQEQSGFFEARTGHDLSGRGLQPLYTSKQKLLPHRSCGSSAHRHGDGPASQRSDHRASNAPSNRCDARLFRVDLLTV
jgi:DNA-binding NtrC family response regulator